LTIGVDPDICEVGPVTVEWHGLLMALGIGVALALAIYLTRKDHLPQEYLLSPALWAIVGGMLGARATHVIDSWDYYASRPEEILDFLGGGLGWYGGLIGGALGGLIAAKIKHVPLGRMFDLVSAPVLLGLAVGRIGCTINGDSHGTATSLPWALTYVHEDAFNQDVAGHPVPVYEILCLLVIAGVLWRIRHRLKPEGSLFFAMLASYSFARFFLSWIRAEDAVLGPLHQSHIISIALFVAAVTVLIVRKAHFESASEDEQEDLAGTEPAEGT
jgi:phosphatidylglycerol:prolipoprotein diacylglycerol transferase